MNQVTLQARDGTRTFGADPGERILHAALRAGIGLPYECATGTCGSCRVVVADGPVESLWPEAPGARLVRTARTVLACQAAACGDVELEVRGALQAFRGDRPEWYRGHIRRSDRLTSEIGCFDVMLDRPMPAMAGQFILAKVPGHPGFRAYSPIRSPCAPEPGLRLLLRTGRAGGASEALFESDEDGLMVQVFGPLGRAVFDPSEARPFLAVAGGSGIAGMLAILDRAERAGHHARHRSQLVFGLRSPGQAYVLDELSARVGSGAGGLAVTVAFSDQPADAGFARAFPFLTFVKGFAHDAARELARGMTGRGLAYVAGPPAMVDATLRMMVTECGFPPSDIRYDRYG